MYSKVILLDKIHQVEEFDCEEPALNTFLKKYALQNQLNYSARTYVTTHNNNVVGFYSLAPASVSYEESPERITKGLARHDVPCILLARLAVDTNHKGKGLGKALLKNALLRAYNVKDLIGGRAVITYAKNNTARQFYLNYGFESSPIDQYYLFLLMKDIEKILKPKR